jgi:RNA polymerase sigma-70 factor (ECF subfamily)
MNIVVSPRQKLAVCQLGITLEFRVSSTESEQEYLPSPMAGCQPAFVTTHWSVVLMAGRSDTPDARAALGRLCQTYWYPIYAYIRRRGQSAHDAQDLTQEFFAHLLERQSLAAAHPERGRFRSFLLTVLNHFLANEWVKARTQKRGGGCPIISLDWAAAEERYDLEPADHFSPDKIFEKQWALTLLSEVLNRLEAEYQEEGKLDLFMLLKQTLTGGSESRTPDIDGCINVRFLPEAISRSLWS